MSQKITLVTLALLVGLVFTANAGATSVLFTNFGHNEEYDRGGYMQCCGYVPGGWGVLGAALIMLGSRMLAAGAKIRRSPFSRKCSWLAILLLVSAGVFPQLLAAATAHNLSPQKLPGLQAAAQIIRDNNDIPHIQANNEHDLAFLQGYVHAQDRLFQMDVSRREASGTLAELVGPAALAQDVQLRTLGLRRAAERSLPLQSPRALVMLQAYADGINAWVSMHPVLPPEY